MKIKRIVSNGFDLDKCYPEHDPEQYSRSFSCQLNTLRNANVLTTVIYLLI